MADLEKIFKTLMYLMAFLILLAFAFKIWQFLGTWNDIASFLRRLFGG